MVQVMAMVPQLAQAALCEASVTSRTDLPFCSAERIRKSKDNRCISAMYLYDHICKSRYFMILLYIFHIHLYIQYIYHIRVL